MRDPEIFESDAYEFLFDAFDYPRAWSKTRAAWVRRTFTLETRRPDRCYVLLFEALMPRATLYVNGQEVAAHNDPTLPFEADVTFWLREGDNEIAVLIEDYERDDQGRALVPTGNLIPCDHSGIWQDVWLVTRSDVTLSDVTIRTSTRTGTLPLLFEVTNASDRRRAVTLITDVRDWARGVDPEVAPVALPLSDRALTLDAGATVEVEVSVPWSDAVWWYPERPKLYQLRTLIREAGAPLEISYERFGFREVWIEGRDIMLNDYPVHLFSDWGHKSTPYYYTEGWIRQWFGMIRDANMNHSRLHTHPHPPINLDLADELGILITGEAGLHGSGGAQAASSPAYWEAAQAHVRRFVRRDKNHPSVILWSVENEMRWNTKGKDAREEVRMIQEELPKLRALFNDLDPTRPAYHDGDSSLWNERSQPIISRHYGKECAGVGWWDQTQPLHSGEMALYHYAGPNNTQHLGGDAVFADFAAIDAVAGQDATWIIEAGRTLGVSCFGPWNLSCLENLRMEPEEVRLAYDDVTVPGVKPLRVPAHASEFSFWRAGKGCTPNTSFAIQAYAFRPFAVIDRSLRTGIVAGTTFRRELFLVNDTPDDVEGELVVTLGRADEAIQSAGYTVNVKRGRVASRVFEVTLPADLAPGVYDYVVLFRRGEEILDTWQRRIKVGRPRYEVPELEGLRMAIYGSEPGGDGGLDAFLGRLGCDYAWVDDLDAASLAEYAILLMAPNTVEPGSRQNQAVRAFVAAGGRLIVMAQRYSLFPEVVLEDKPVLKAFVRSFDHPVLAQVEDDELFAWGDDPYPLLASDAYVARRMYRKDDGRLMQPLLDSGEGGFGSGDLDLTPLFEAWEGEGVILACQLRLIDKLDVVPAAGQLLVNLLRRAATYAPPEPTTAFQIVSGDEIAGLARYCDAARSGQTVIVQNATPAALEAWAEVLDVALRPKDVGEVYQVVRVRDDPLLSGVSNEDTCGIETFSYTPATAENFLVGETFLAPAPGLDTLLQTPTESCLRELMVYNGRSEALRTHTLSRFLFGEKRQAAVALGRVAVGKGAVIFNQFAPPEASRPRFARLSHRLRANLGEHFAGSLLAGDGVPAARTVSPGYPQAVYLYNGPVDGALWREMVERCAPSMERMLATPILNLVSWQRLGSEEGVWCAAGLDLDDEVYLYHTIWSPSPRKNLQTNLDVPNPEALTFLDLAGRGRVGVVVNGQAFEPVTLTGGGATISDIPLEMGGNHVLIRWSPDSEEATLRMRWRNIMRQPEVELQFGSSGSAN
jgi:hypothetical protein